MNVDVYLNYAGTCEPAFRFYEQQLGGRIVMMVKHENQPGVLHAVIEIGGTLVRGADIPGAEPMRSAYLTLRVDSIEEAERIYLLLTEGGQIFMKMEETFFAKRFAMFRDKFGTSWLLMHQRAAT